MGVRAPEWAPWWVCYEATREGSPWVVRSYRSSKRDNRHRGYFSRREAARRVERLRPLWEKWTFIATMRLIPEHKWTEGFTTDEYVAAGRDLEGRRLVRLAFLDIRRLARLVGLDPDEVVRQEGDRLSAGRLLIEQGPAIDRLLESAERPFLVTIGQTFQPLDRRRVGRFTIARIEGDRVVGDDGRTVAVGRLLTRYRPVP